MKKEDDLTHVQGPITLHYCEECMKKHLKHDEPLIQAKVLEMLRKTEDAAMRL